MYVIVHACVLPPLQSQVRGVLSTRVSSSAVMLQPQKQQVRWGGGGQLLRIMISASRGCICGVGCQLLSRWQDRRQLGYTPELRPTQQPLNSELHCRLSVYRVVCAHTVCLTSPRQVYRAALLRTLGLLQVVRVLLVLREMQVRE